MSKIKDNSAPFSVFDIPNDIISKLAIACKSSEDSNNSQKDTNRVDPVSARKKFEIKLNWSSMGNTHGLRCQTCGITNFSNIEEQRTHFKSKDHADRLLVKLKKQNEHESNSTNSAEKKSLNQKSKANDKENQDQVFLFDKNMVTFKVNRVEYSLYTSLLALDPLGALTQTIVFTHLKNLALFSTVTIMLCSLGRGDFVLGTIDTKTGKLVFKKTIHKYVSRRKQGGLQIKHDNSDRPKNSAGAQIRRSLHTKFIQEMIDVLKAVESKYIFYWVNGNENLKYVEKNVLANVFTSSTGFTLPKPTGGKGQGSPLGDSEFQSSSAIPATSVLSSNGKFQISTRFVKLPAITVKEAENVIGFNQKHKKQKIGIEYVSIIYDRLTRVYINKGDTTIPTSNTKNEANGVEGAKDTQDMDDGYCSGSDSGSDTSVATVQLDENDYCYDDYTNYILKTAKLMSAPKNKVSDTKIIEHLKSTLDYLLFQVFSNESIDVKYIPPLSLNSHLHSDTHANTKISVNGCDTPTFLHLAAQKNRTKVVQFLLENEIDDLTIRNEAGKTAYQLSKNKHVQKVFANYRKNYSGDADFNWKETKIPATD
ncbi:hypothetical protein AX774_g1372 [Zancudomyces culisetae]|uniref:VLRF1 domain-containing protein n=1 Tax=Zancudomyces culisetae TaxID=1213189 RepID=A0A1R1PQA3_ZANCU|nr:hypothetical protein AX774_g7310 [Zancudomyces culisetae]OMH83165.1 hypothetical protein AX774_g3326 [Zancudomyces culisetae]OMH85105.1 hypothetical protein AX774_g1372 [Zancudomyces culisetae]|eukprot:OMH79277.1 hypothetical protein AX774_g7310 [Zancudomyces culisetae]